MTVRLLNANSSTNIYQPRSIEFVQVWHFCFLWRLQCTPLRRIDKCYYSVRLIATQSNTSRTPHTFSVRARVRINIWAPNTQYFRLLRLMFFHICMDWREHSYLAATRLRRVVEHVCVRLSVTSNEVARKEIKNNNRPTTQYT